MTNQRRAFRLLAAILSGTILIPAGLARPQGKSDAPQIEVPATPVGKVLAEWLSAFNSGDADRIRKFQADHSDPGHRNVQRDVSLREQTGGFDLRRIETSTTTEIIAVVKEKNSNNLARLTLETSATDPSHITNFGLRTIAGAEPGDSASSPGRETLSQLTQEVDSRLTKLAADDKFSGTVLVAKDGGILWQKAYGYADRETKIPNTVETRFRLGSMNKMFTSIAIAQLVQQGKLTFADTIAQVLPDYPNKEAANKVTVDQLLTHSSGLGDFFGPEFAERKGSLHELKDYLPLFANKPLQFEPGKGWSYSNAGFLVLGLMVERLSGQDYYDYVQQHIYDAAGMKNTGSVPITQSVADLAVGYTRESEESENGPLRPNTGTLPWRASPAGGGDSTVGDLLKFDQALRGHKLLSPELTQTVLAGKVHPPRFPEDVKYAYGFSERTVNGHRIVGHNGGAPGMNAQLDMHLDSGYTVVVLANCDPHVAEEWANYISDRLVANK